MMPSLQLYCKIWYEPGALAFLLNHVNPSEIWSESKRILVESRKIFVSCFFLFLFQCLLFHSLPNNSTILLIQPFGIPFSSNIVLVSLLKVMYLFRAIVLVTQTQKTSLQSFS